MGDPFMGQWLLLIHQIPPKPAYFRAKVMRRLSQLGALPIKNSAYVLPNTPDLLEDFQWMAREIGEEGGEAWLFQTDVVSGLTDESLQAGFRKLREADYAELCELGRGLLARARGEDLGKARGSLETEWRKLNRRSAEIGRIDYFPSSGRIELEALLKTIDQLLHPSDSGAAVSGLGDLTGRTWVTRRGIKVDRMASAWFIKRFLDPAAKFLFVESDAYKPQDGELRFDMFEGEFTHQGDLCTFEVLLAGSGIDDPGLRVIGEIIHDLDLKDGKFQRPEVSGIALTLEGFIRLNRDDEARLEMGSNLFESLYAALSQTVED